MLIVIACILILLWISAVSVVGQLDRIAKHNEKFDPNGVEVGREIWIEAMGKQQKCVVTAVAPDGGLLVEPVPQAPVAP